jgi:hypothetical protein
LRSCRASFWRLRLIWDLMLAIDPPAVGSRSVERPEKTPIAPDAFEGIGDRMAEI